jgi:hypothetical protein
MFKEASCGKLFISAFKSFILLMKFIFEGNRGGQVIFVLAGDWRPLP